MLSLPTALWGQHHQVFVQDSFQPKRFWMVAGVGTVLYGSAVVGLNEAWYKQNPRTGFHFFNDWREWQNMDKMGHAFTAYFETELCFKGALWTGMNRKSASWTAAGLAMVFQGSIEIMDAYAEEWGFSVPDLVFNMAGIGLYTAQELFWKEQRIRMKISNWPKAYAQTPIPSVDGSTMTTLHTRANELFGTHFAERYLKDYNAQTVWISFNPKSFLPQSKLPPWLNIAVGYSSENLFGGFTNSWEHQGHTFHLSRSDHPRYRQWFLSPDVDFNRIHTEKKWLKTVFSVLNIFKIPAPALEYNTQGQGQWRFHWLFL